MIVEDGRRLIISNMDFRWVTTNGGHRIGGPTTYSAEAIELFRLLPKEASHIRLATAARMSASFPYVSSPAVLPTNPRRRVVDAGYYDNYGVSLAASWLFSGSHQRTLAERKIQRVLLIQIRDGISDPHRKLDVVGARETNQLMRAAEEFTTPLTGFYNGQNSSSSFRNDGLLEVLSHLYEAKRKPTRYSNNNLQVKAISENFMTMTLEYSGNASLSWYLTDDERESIRNSSELITDRGLRDLESLNRDEAEILLGDENEQRQRRGDLDEICRERLTHRMRQLVKWWLESHETTTRPPPFTVVPEAEVDDDLDRKYLKAGYRRFSMWLKVPPKHSDDIKSVTYLMNHPSFYHKELPATQGQSDDYRVSYIGYGALNQVVVRIVMNNGKIYETDFDQQAKTYR